MVPSQKCIILKNKLFILIVFNYGLGFSYECAQKKSRNELQYFENNRHSTKAHFVYIQKCL